MSLLSRRAGSLLVLVVCLCIAVTPCCKAQGSSGDDLIQDDNVTIGFDSEELTVFEGNIIIVCVTSSMLVDNQSIVVSLSTQDDGAMAGTDYEAVTTDLTFEVDMEQQCVNITTMDNPASDDRQFTVLLSSNSSAELSPNVTSVTIRNVEMTVIVADPDSVTVIGGDSATFTINATGTEPLSYQWQVNGTDISDIMSTNVMGVTTDTLTVMNTGNEDEGDYRCVVTDVVGDSITSNEATLTVVVAPTILEQPRDALLVIPNAMVTFTVVADEGPLTYQWFRMSARENTPIVNATEQTYTIESATEEDEGMYFCNVTNAADSVLTEAVRLMLLPLPNIDPGPVDGIVLVNDDITFNCTASNANITWMVVDSDNMTVPFSTDVASGTSTITVSVPSPGVYTVNCVATNDRGTNMSQATFNAIEIEVEDVEAGVSGMAVFFCNVTGSTGLTGGVDIEYNWTTVRNGVSPRDGFPDTHFGDRERSDGVNPILTIFNVSQEDDGFNYTCVVRDLSRMGQDVGNATATLTAVGPEITVPPLDQLLDAGDTLRLVCTAVNNVGAGDNLTIAWRFRSLDNPSGSRLFFVNDQRVTQTYLGNRTFESVFSIEETVSSDGGDYTCFVYNRAFSDAINATAVVTVFFTPVLEFEPMPTVKVNRALTLLCTVTAQPNATFAEIARFTNGTRTVVAMVNNTEGSRIFSVMYMLNASFEDDDALFQCLAENSNGPATLNATVVVQARPTAIDHTRDVTSELASLDSVNITWTAPAARNSLITHYIISWCQFSFTDNCTEIGKLTLPVSGDTSLINISSTQVRFQITDLPPEQRYQVRIRAMNAVGTQPNPADVDGGFNFSSTFPADVTVENLRNITSSSAVIFTWRLPALAIATNNLNVSFNISYFDIGNPGNVTSATAMYDDNLVDQGFAINTFETGRQHNVSVTANYINRGLTAAPVTLQMIELAAEDTPLIPDTEVTPIIDARDVLTVRWPRPENTNFLTGFRVMYSSTSLLSGSRRRRRQTMMMDVTDPNADSATLTFEPYSMFAVDIDALYRPPPGSNEVVVPLLPTSNFPTPQRPPGPPMLQTVENEGLLKLLVTWTPPAMPNGVIMQYWVILNDSVTISAGDGSTRSWVSQALHPNALHTITVVAETDRNNGGGMGEASNPVMRRTLFGVAQPLLFNPIIGTSDRPQFSITYGTFLTTLGPVDRFQIVVIRGGGIEDTVQQIPSNMLHPENVSSLSYYVAFSGPVPGRQTTFTIGDGVTRIDRGIFYPNPPPDTGVDYRIFIRVFSAIDGTVFNDSALTGVLRINTPLNPATIIAPIAAIAVVLLIILIVLLLVVFLFTRPRRGYTIASTREDGRPGKKRGGGIEMRRTRLFSPVVNVPIPDVFTSAGQPTTLVCEASGTPAPEVVWTQNNDPLDKERFIQLADSSLFINDTDLKDEGAYVVTATNSAGTAEQMVRITVIRPSAPEPDPDHPPVKVGEFTEKIALLRAEDDEGLEDEYTDLEPEITFTNYAAKLNINKNKNRYINIIPYDHSRVVLSLQDNTPGSDYINASYVDGFNRPNAYIATQGPQPSTFPDFWRMIWEFDCPTIVMVTNLKEEDKLKCHQYWPSYGTITYGSIQVTLKGVENLAEYSIRTFHVTPIAGQSRVQMPVREVKQFHFLVWPDHGVPQFATPLLSFRKRVAKYHPDKKGPMVVHCSAGVGRTGTFITIDTMLRKMESEGVLDIFNFVRHMRFRRNYMVQTGPQYVFIHDAMLEAIMCGDNSMPAPEVKKRFQELMEVDPESNKSRLQLQFENLNSNSPQDDDFDSTIASLPDNMAKNRFKVHLPANDYRVPLGAPPPRSEADEDADEDEEEKEKEEPDYICASFADGYRQRNAFIITQAPMTSTTGDFWKMIWEQKSAAIVMLTELEEDGKEMSVKYWPGEVGEASLFGSFQLELSEDEKDKGDYVTRKFKLSHVDTPQDCRIVTQFHFTKWPRTSVPKNPQSVIDLIDEIQRVQRKSGNQPITIHCDDGVSRTGAFCTLYSVLERVKVDQVVDIYLATKTLRIQRAGVLETFEQYVFVHKAVLEFLESFSDYQNFK